MSNVEINQDGCNALAEFVKHRASGAALAIGLDMQRFAAVDTGAMSRSVGVDQVSDTRWRIHAGRGLPDARVIYNEFGTHNQDGSVKMHAQPFIRPAVYHPRVF